MVEPVCAASERHLAVAPRSSKSEYATGVTINVSRSESICPPMTTTAMERRSSALGPSASGSMPAMEKADTFFQANEKSWDFFGPIVTNYLDKDFTLACAGKGILESHHFSAVIRR